MVIITVYIEMEIRGLSVSTTAVSRSVSCFTEIIPDFLTSLGKNRLVMAFLTCASCVCPCVMFLIPEIYRSVRFDVLISQDPLIFSSRSLAVSFFKATVRISSGCFPPCLVSCRNSYPMPLVQAPQEVLHNHCL